MEVDFPGPVPETERLPMRGREPGLRTMDSSVSPNQRYIEATLQNGTDLDLQQLFRESHPADLAEALEDLDEKRRDLVLKLMPSDAFGELIEFMAAEDAVEHLDNSEQEYRKEALTNLPDDELVDLLQEIPEENRESYVGLLPDEVKEKSRKLLQYPEESAGGRMTTDIATVQASRSIRQAIEELSAIKETSELLARIYVVDESGRLLGKVRLRDLTFNPRDTLIRDVMDDDLMAIDAWADQEEAARRIRRYDLVALPVVNPERQVLGIITHDDAMEILEEESTEDMEKISGIQASPPDETYLRTSVMGHFRRRCGWVVTMAFLSIASGLVLYEFEHVLAAVALLAVYIPMVVAAGGNTGAQAATMVIRAMSLGEFSPRDYLKVLWKEARIGLLLGLLIGVLIFLQIRFLNIGSYPDAMSITLIALTVGIALMAQIITVTVLGSSLPLLARYLRLDPAAVSSPVITTVGDVTGLVIYFTLAGSVLGL